MEHVDRRVRPPQHRNPPAAARQSEAARVGGGRPATWLTFGWQVGLVAGVELADDSLHALTGLSNRRAGILDALRLVHFERLHGLWVEPAVQRFFERTHHLLGLTLGWVQMLPLFDTIYGPCHVLVTLAFAVWVYRRRQRLFAPLRNLFLVTNALAVLIYEAFPTAPPRLTPGLHYHGRAYHFADAVFGGASGLKIGFNEYAAMPSLHVAWALIVGATVASAARPLAVRLLAPLWPVVMLVAVVVTGNHYLADALGALVVLCAATALALLIEWRRRGTG